MTGEKPSYKRQRNNDDGLELVAVRSLPFRPLTHKPVSQDVCERFGVRVAVSEEDGTPQKVYYPYHDQDGNVVGYKVRHLPKDFAVIGKLKGLFGQKQCKPGAKLLIITEGEDDALAAYQMFLERGKNYNVVSIPNGANREGKVDPQVAAEIEFITSHQLVVLALDNDAPGQATANALAEMLVSQCRVKVLKLPRKDAGQMLIDGMSEQFEKELYTKDYQPDAVENGRVEDLSEILTPTASGVFLDCLPKTSKKLYGLRPGEMTIILAPPGVGKTTMSGMILHELLTKQPDPVFGMFLEETKKKTRQRIFALDAGVALNRFRRDPSIVDPAQVRKTNDEMMGRLELLSNNKCLTTDASLVNRINYFVKAKGCKYGVLDHISYVIAARKAENERKDIDELLTKLSQLVEDQQFHLIVVAHIKRKTRDREKSGERKYPYWTPLELDSARGSGAFEQLAHNIIAIERQETDPALEDEIPLTRTRILKSREEGVLGIGDILQYDRERGVPVPLSLDYQ